MRPIEKALLIVKERMKISGIRPVASQEYINIMKRFAIEMELVYLDGNTIHVLFEWLSKLGDVSNVTKQSKLGCLRLY